LRMLLQKVRIQGFRNFSEKLFEFSDGTTIVVGPNGSGKTNLLEAIYLLSVGKSFKARVEDEMISYKKGLAHTKGRVLYNDISTDLEVVLTRGEISGERAPKKRLLVNNTPKRLVDFASNLRVVLFSPEDLDLVLESPSIRRRFLDSVLSQSDYEYRRSLLAYEKGLRRRNRILISIREEGAPRTHLTFWDKLLIKNGNYLTSSRQKLIDFINDSPSLNETEFNLEYDLSGISEERLAQYAREEVAAGMTLVGPHRDDFIFKVKPGKASRRGRELVAYGSRGEQRMGVLWVKLAELSYIKSETKEDPLLLLDDIFSELDKSHRKIVKLATKKFQTIITTADPHFIKNFKGVEKIELKG